MIPGLDFKSPKNKLDISSKIEDRAYNCVWCVMTRLEKCIFDALEYESWESLPDNCLTVSCLIQLLFRAHLVARSKM